MSNPRALTNSLADPFIASLVTRIRPCATWAEVAALTETNGSGYLVSVLEAAKASAPGHEGALAASTIAHRYALARHLDEYILSVLAIVEPELSSLAGSIAAGLHDAITSAQWAERAGSVATRLEVALSTASICAAIQFGASSPVIDGTAHRFVRSLNLLRRVTADPAAPLVSPVDAKAVHIIGDTSAAALIRIAQHTVDSAVAKVSAATVAEQKRDSRTIAAPAPGLN